MSAYKDLHDSPESQQKQNTSKDGPGNDRPGNGITRRGFLKGAGITAAGTALLEGVHGFNTSAQAADSGVTVIGPGAVPVTLNVNG